MADYYEILQISRNADADTIERVYRLLSGRYHPDNLATADLDRFLIIKEAWETLSDPVRRLDYDKRLETEAAKPIPIFQTREFSEGIEAESKIRLGVLCLLYAQRRQNADHPSLSLLDLEKLMAFPREHLLFSVWFLKSKKYVLADDRSSMLITAEGIDYLEMMMYRNDTAARIFRSTDATWSRVSREIRQPSRPSLESGSL